MAFDGLSTDTLDAEGFVFKISEGRLKPIPCRVDPGDIVVRASGLYVIEACEPEDVICMAHSLTWHLQTRRDAIGRLLGEGFKG